MPDRICDPMAPKGLYSVQKSRSFGGINKYRDSPPGDSSIPAEQGRRTPNFGSLRKKFSKKKSTSFDEDDGDYADGSSLKKKSKSKVGNLFKWFKKDNSKDQSFESDNLTPKLTRVIQKPSEAPQTITVSPLKHKSCSYDSICSVGSATSSFAFVPVNAYKVGRCVESKKRIAIGLNCGVDTYKARMDQRQNGLECDKDVTLKTKYKLMPSESPPTLKKDENFSAISGPQLPSGPILPSSQLNKGDNSGSDSDDTVELESISQRGSPVRWTVPAPQVASSDQQQQTADKNASPSQPIKPRQLSGQLLHPMTIKLNDDSKKNALNDIGNESENGTLKYFQSRQFADLERLGSESGSATKPESLPNISTAEGQQVLHYPQSSKSSNPFGDTASLAATLPLQKRGDVSSVSPRSSLSGDDYRPPNHIPGKRKAPGPPGERPVSPSNISDKSVTPKVTRSKDYSNPFVKKKGPAPQPPTENKANSLENGFTVSAGLASFQSSSSRPSSRQSEKIKSENISSNRQVMTGSAPTSPLLSKRFVNDKSLEHKNEWVFEGGVLKSSRESKQNISASLAEEKEPKEIKAPLSPKPWYKRSIAKDGNDKKSKDKSKDTSKKAKTPENLPEIHTSRESIRVKETFEEKYSYFVRMSKENLSEVPKSPKLFLRNKIMSSSPKAERPSSRPISGLTGISDLDRQAAEIIRRKNEDEAAKKKANDEKFYTDKDESESAQQALDIIMDNVSKKMHCLDKIEKHNDRWEVFMDNKLKIEPAIARNGVSAENERNYSNKNQNENSSKVAIEIKDSNNAKNESNSKSIKSVNGRAENEDSVTNSYKKIEIDISPKGPINMHQSDNKNCKKEDKKLAKESDIEQDVQSMDNVVSDLNSFLASTRKAMSSPSSQKRLFSLPLLQNSPQVKEANVKRTTTASPTSNSMPVVKGAGTNNQHKENTTLFSSTISPIIEQSETTSNSSVSSTPVFGGPFFKDQGKPDNDDIKDVNNPQNRNSNSFPAVSSTEQKVNYIPPSSIPSSEYKSNLPPPPTQAPLPPLAVEKQDGWSCHRCTLINYNAQLWCEACGGKRLFTNVQEDLNCQTSVNNANTKLAINEQDLDTESEDAPPRIGNVLDKLVLFSAIDAKARETPTLQRRRSADINKLSRTYSNAMLPIDENPLQKTLDRISEKQAELAKSKDYFNGNSQRSSPKDVSSECSSSERENKTSSHRDIIKEQERLFEEARANLMKQKQNEEKMELAEKTSTLPLNSMHRSNQNDQFSTQLENGNVQQLGNQSEERANRMKQKENEEKLELAEKLSLPLNSMQRSNQIDQFSTQIETEKVQKLGKQTDEQVQVSKETEVLRQKITPTQLIVSDTGDKNKNLKHEEEKLQIVESPKQPDFNISNVKTPPSVQIKRASSFKGSFDFTKTPRAFIASKTAGQAPPWTKYVSDDNKVNVVTAPKLEFLGSEVTRKYSTPDTDQMRRARLDFFTPNDDNHTQNLKPIGNVNTKVIDKLEMGVKKEEPKSGSLLEDPTKPNINTIPKQRNSMTNLNKQLSMSRINSVISLSTSDPYYAHPVSPPRPVTPPRPKSPENFTETQAKLPTIYKPTKPDSPSISKPKRPKSPEIVSSDDEDTPPPRPASPIFQYPSLPRSIPPVNANVSSSLKSNSSLERKITAPEKPVLREENKTPVNHKRMSHERDNLAELVNAHFANRNLNSRPCTPQGPSGGYTSRPYTPQEIVQSQSRSRIPVARNSATPPNNYYRDFRDSRPTTPLLSKQNSFDNFGQFMQSPSTHRFEDQYNKRHSSDIYDSADYGVYQMSRDFVRTPSIIDERALSRIGSTSLVSESNYSAFTPIVERKMSVSSISTPLATPKLNRDFGFVSSKKDNMPKPPRRRSKDTRDGFDSRPQSRQIKSSSRETTPVNNPLSPVRPSRLRGKNYPQQKPNKKLNCDNNKSNRPKSLQENPQEPLYEILTPPSNTFHAANRHHYSSSDSDSDFKTPQASPKFMRPTSKNKKKETRKSSIYEDIDVGQSYENFKDNPVLENSKKISRVTKNDKDYALPAKINKPKVIPPRTSQEPIPTPRKPSLSRSRDQSTESIPRMNSLPRGLYPKKEPHYKVPPPNPKLVNPNDHHFYSEPLYEEDQINPNDPSANQPKNINKSSKGKSIDENQNIRNVKDSNVSKSVKATPSQEHTKKAIEKQYTKPSKQDTSRQDEKSTKTPSIKQDRNIPPNLRSKQKNRKKIIDLESSTNNLADTRVEVELSETDDRFYDTKEEMGAAVLIKKSKGIATLPDGSKYPCVIVQKKAKKESNGEQNKQNKDNKMVEVPPKKTERKVKNYIPTEMPMKPDWFDDLKIKKDVKKSPRPSSIIDGVLYTSKALIEADSRVKKLATFNLIEQEVFETYDVCKNQTMKSEEKRNTAEDVRVQPTHSYQAQDSYENTEQPRETSKISYPNNPVFSQDNLDTRPPTEFKKTSADNPFRCKSSQSSVHDETEVATNKGVDTFKALLVGQGEGPSGDLLRQLEVAITKGDHKYAASLAKDLAKLKISSRLTEQESDDKKAKQNSLAIKLVKANMFVEDAVSAQGPIVVEVNPVITVAELKLQIEKEFEIPVDVQKWILGKNLVSEDSLTLQSQGIDVDGAEIFLYLVNPAEKQAEIAAAGAIPEVPKATVPPKIPLVLPTEPFQKGRYWNYEEDRWSVCNSDDDDEREEEVKQMVTKGNVELAGEVAAAAAAVAAPNEDEEWEYYYEDVDIKAKANKEKPNPIQEQPVAAAPVLPQLAELPKTSIFRNLGKADEPKPAELKPQVINNEPVPGTSATPVQELVVPKDAEKNPTGWECPVCTLMNPLERPGCLACTTERPADLGAAAAPDQPAADNKEKPKEEKKNAFEAYKQLENLDIIPNAENFECTVCFLDTEPGDGVVLRECLHTFCKICLAASIEHSDTPKVKCPFKDDNYSCDMELLEREIKALVTPAILEKHQKKSVNEAAATIQNAFHCKTPDCAGWTVIEDNVNIFKCQVCKRTNCITCQAIHDGMDCKQYQQYMLVDAQDENSKKTKEWMDDLIGKGEALHCPSCQVLLLKKWGCDWVRCTYCRTEICWVTKQLRWGPNGRGDTSGGCKCMIDGRTKCHKNCNYCH